MDHGQTIRQPQAFRANWSPQPTVFAPYWCLADNSYSSTLSPHQRSYVWYHVFSNYPGQVQSQVDYQTISAIDSLVTSKYHQNDSVDFRSRWSLLVTWQRITPYPSQYQYTQVQNQSLVRIACAFEAAGSSKLCWDLK